MFVAHIMFADGDGVGYFAISDSEPELYVKMKAILTERGGEPDVVAEVQGIANPAEWVSAYHHLSQHSLVYEAEPERIY